MVAAERNHVGCGIGNVRRVGCCSPGFVRGGAWINSVFIRGEGAFLTFGGLFKLKWEVVTLNITRTNYK